MKLLALGGLLVLAGSCLHVRAEWIQLKENHAILGKVIGEKRDQIFVDVGYTILVVPRNQVTRVSEGPPAVGATTPSKKRSTRGPAPRTAAVETPPVEVPEPAPPIGDRPVRELVGELGESVVQVRTPSSLGSGFILDEEGLLITNFHVIENETQLSVEVYHQKDGKLERTSYKQVRIVALNKFADLALLKIEDPGAPKFKRVGLADSDGLSVGEAVFAIGSPLGLERTVTEGIVSTKTRPLQGELYIQTTTQINPGNSGGPLFNLRGEVVGVTNMKMTFGEGLGFAIPVDTLRRFLQHRDAYAYDNDNPSNPYRYLPPPGRTRTAVEPAGDIKPRTPP